MELAKQVADKKEEELPQKTETIEQQSDATAKTTATSTAAKPVASENQEENKEVVDKKTEEASMKREFE